MPESALDNVKHIKKHTEEIPSSDPEARQFLETLNEWPDKLTVLIKSPCSGAFMPTMNRTTCVSSTTMQTKSKKNRRLGSM